jgi:hypothetical protein
MFDIQTPIRSLLALPGLATLARLALATPFLVSGVMKLFDLDGAAAEMAALGLTPPLLFASLVIATQIGGSLLLLMRAGAGSVPACSPGSPSSRRCSPTGSGRSKESIAHSR